MPLKGLTPDGHLGLIEGILHDVIGVELVDAAHDDLDVGLLGLGKEQELGAREGLEAGQAEEGALENFEAGEGGTRQGGLGRVDNGRGGQGAGYCVDAEGGKGEGWLVWR